MSPEERARRIKYNIPDDPAKRALTPEQEAAIARLTGNVPGRTPRSPHRSREAPPYDRARPQSTPEVGERQERTEISGLRARHASDLSEATDRRQPRDDHQSDQGSDGPRSRGSVRDHYEPERPGAEHPGNGQHGDHPYGGQASTDQPPDDHRDSASDGPGDGPNGPRSRDQHERPDQPTDLDVANAQIAELKKELADRDAKLEAAYARLDEQAAEIGALKEKAGKQDNVLGDLLERVGNLEQRPAGSAEGVGDRRVDAPTGVVADGNPIADEPKRPRINLRAKAWEAAVTGGGLSAAVMEIGPHVPAYVLAVGAAAAGAAKPMASLGRETVAWYRAWRTERNADRPEG